MTVFPELDPFEYALEALPTDDPDGAALVPDRETYYANMGTADVVFTGDVTLKVGDRTFHLLHTPGHTPGQIAVYVPEERVVFTGDTIFSECTTWLMTSNVDQWIEALDRIRALDIDHVVPGHGPVQPKSYLATQRAFLLEWKTAVAVAVAKGWSREETIARVTLRRALPGRHRAGVHDGVHPGAQRRRALGQAHGRDDDDISGQGAAGPLMAR